LADYTKTKKNRTGLAIFITVIVFIVIIVGLLSAVYFNFFKLGTKSLEILRKSDSVFIAETEATTAIQTALSEKETLLNEKVAELESKEYEITNRENEIIQKETDINAMNEMLNGKITDITKLVEIYTKMDPAVAASILEIQEDENLTLNILKNMDSEVASSILSNMTKKIAAQLTLNMMN